MNTFKDICDVTKNRIDELDEDSQIDVIIKSAINHSYLFDLSKLDKRLSFADLIVINGMALLPDDCLTIVKITPELTQGEFRVGNAILTNRNITFSIIYTSVPDPLVNDSDEPNLSSQLKYMLSTYACYAYFSYRKKTSVAQMFLAEYENQKASYTTIDNINETVQNVYPNTINIGGGIGG